MLVLSRRPEEKILLPTVPAIIKIISAQAGLVRLGIEAPVHVPIVREELYHGVASAGSPAEAAEFPLPPAVRNHVNHLILGLALLRMQLADCSPVVRKTIDDLEAELQALCGPVAAPVDDAVRPPRRKRAVPVRV